MADEQPPELDDEVLVFAARMFDLARSGDTAALAAYVDAGLPVNLTNAKGDSLLMLAAYYDHPETVQALLERGADTGRGSTTGARRRCRPPSSGAPPTASSRCS